MTNKFEKGSEAAKEHMAKIRAMRKNKQPTQNETQSIGNNAEPVDTNQKETQKQRGKLIKESIEAKQYMAEIRSKKKQS